MNKAAEAHTLWLIPARAGSKGIPKKNIIPFCGKSLVERAVDQALECASSDDMVFVSTDSTEIADAIRKKGVDIPFLRPDELAADGTPTYPVIIHALDEFEKLRHNFSKVVLLQPTSPLRQPVDIKRACELWNNEIDMVVSVMPARTNPYYNAFEVNDKGFLHISKGDGKIARRQDAPIVWEYNGAVYVISVTSLRKGDFSTFNRIIPSPMDEIRSVDLDTPADWAIAEHLYKSLISKNIIKD